MTQATPTVLPVRTLYVLIVAWASFACAAVATMLFFATFDPEQLANAATFPLALDRTTGYTLGFLSLWLLAAASSATTLFLARSIPLHRKS